jgi:hypothetical protein
MTIELLTQWMHHRAGKILDLPLGQADLLVKRGRARHVETLVPVAPGLAQFAGAVAEAVTGRRKRK